MKRQSRFSVLAAIILVVALACAPLPMIGRPARAADPTDIPAPSGANDLLAPFVVNTTDDVDDGVCNAAHCSLREALAAAGTNAGPDTVSFSIPTPDPGYYPATGVWTIRPTAGYNVPAQTTVEGPLAGGGIVTWPAIEIDGTTLGALGITGIRLNAAVTLRNLAVNHFQYGIWINSNSVTVERCYIGTDATGTIVKANGQDGILVTNGVTGAVIQHNLLSGNTGGGIRMFGAGTSGNTIWDNRIGVNAAGTAALPNGESGIWLQDGVHGNWIEDNLVSGNRAHGIHLTDAGTNGNVLAGNRVGTDASGVGALPNGAFGVALFDGPSNNQIGPDNRIAYNTMDGVLVDGSDSFTSTLGNRITANHITSNGDQGIDNMRGGNAEIAPPIITGVAAGAVAGTACSLCVVEVFSDNVDQGAVFEGTATANASGAWSFAKLAGFSGPYLTATASDVAGNTSEFSAPFSLWPTPTASATPTSTRTQTPTATMTATRTPTGTTTSTRTQTGITTATRTTTAPITATRTTTGIATATRTTTATITATRTATTTVTRTATATATRTRTATRTGTVPAWPHAVRLPIIVSKW